MVDKIYKRKLVEELQDYLDSREAVIIYGARQVGKTTLLKYLIRHYLRENSFYLDLEYRDLLDLCNQGAQAVYDYILQKGADEKKKIYVIIDEIQYLNDPANLIKLIHDHYLNIKLILSGSSTFEIKKKFKDSLVGRTINFEIYPLSFEEFLTFRNKHYKLKKENVQAVNEELIVLAEEYIKYGGYPGIVLEKSEDKKKAYLTQIINTYIRKDIRDIGNIRNISSFNKLVEVLASQSGQLLNVSELSNTLGITRETAIDYLDLLENTFIIKLARPFHRNMRSELTKNPKVYFLDTGMMHLLWLKEFPRIIFGSVFETFVFIELLKAGKKINFWRTTNKQEIDFIVKDRQLYAIEAKYNFQKSNHRHLEFFAGKYNCKTAVVGLKGKKSGKYIWELLEELK